MTLICFIIILGVTIFIHELGHFLFAKKSNVHCYEFSLGMGPRIFKFNRKNDETTYSLRLFPIGGFVSMAGEDTIDKEIDSDRQLANKPWHQRFLTIVAGVLFNFLLAIVLLFIVGLITGNPNNKPITSDVIVNGPAYNAGLKENQLITEVNGKKVGSIDHFLLEMQTNKDKPISLTLSNEKVIKIKPEKKNDKYIYGFSLDDSKKYGFFEAIKYAFGKFFSLIIQMILIIGYLFSGKLSLNNLAGPVGIYSVVGQSYQAGLINLVYLTALLSLNVGFLNLLPIPAFDGGRLLFLIIEKIKGSKVDSKVENTIHSIGFILLMILMVAVTYNDIIRLISG